MLVVLPRTDVDDGQLTAKVNQQEVAHITIVVFILRKIMTHYCVQNMPIVGENKSTTAAYRCFPALQMLIFSPTELQIRENREQGYSCFLLQSQSKKVFSSSISSRFRYSS